MKINKDLIKETSDIIVDSIRTKNMLDTNKAYVSSGSVSILNSTKGTLDIQVTSGYYSRVSVKIPVTPNKTYTLSYTATISSGTSSPNVVVRKLDDSTNIVQEGGEGDKTLTFSTTETGVIISFFGTMSENTGRKLYENIQLEEGSTATLYRPYQKLDSTGYVLFSGETIGATLSDNVDNYSYLEIYGKESGNRCIYTKVDKGSTFINKKFILQGSFVVGSALYIRGTVYQIGQNAITADTIYQSVAYTGGSITNTIENQTTIITKVVGYK